MPLIIRNQHLAGHEAENVANKVDAKLQATGAMLPALPAAVNLPCDPDDPYSPATVLTTNPGELIKPEVQMAPAAVGVPDGVVDRIRKYIPSEATVAWGVIKMGFESSYAYPLTPVQMTAYFVVWGCYIVLVFFYVLLSLQQERTKMEFQTHVSGGDITVHAFVSTLAFVIYSSLVGPPVSYLRLPIWVSYVGVAVFVLFAGFIPSPYITPKKKAARVGVNTPLVPPVQEPQ